MKLFFLVSVITSISFGATLHELKINEAQAEVDYFRNRISTAVVLRRKAEVETELARRDLERNRKLIAKGAVTVEELDHSEHWHSQAGLNQDLMDSRIEELKAELRAAESRLEQIKGGADQVNNTRALHMRSQRGEDVADELAICAVLFPEEGGSSRTAMPRRR